MDASSDRDSAAQTRERIDHVVALLEIVYQANGRLAAELDRLASSRASVSDAPVAGLLRLADDVRPGAAARAAHLAELDRDVQIVGAAEWIARRRRLEPDAKLVPTVRPSETTANPHTLLLGAPRRETSAAERARTRWYAQGEPR